MRDQNVATQSDKLDSYELSQSPDSKIDQGAESTQPYKVRDPDAGFMRVPKDDEAYEEEDLRQGIKNMSQLENKRNQMKIKKVYLQRVIKEEMQKLLEGQRRRRMAQPKAAAAPAVDPYLTQPNASAVAAARKAAQPLPPPPPVGVAPVKRSAQAGTALKPGVKVPMPSTDAPPVSMHYVPGTVNPAVNAKVASVEKGQHPVQQGIYNLKSLQPAAQGANVPVYSALGVQMGSVPAGKAPPNLLPIKDEQGSIIGYKSPN